ASSDAAGPVGSQGHNLIGVGAGGSGFGPTDLVGTAALPLDPLLEPLGDYGGPTPTMRPLPWSPALNAGDNADAPETDQRGFDRLVLGYIDIGAVELQPDEFGGPGPAAAPAGARPASAPPPAVLVALAATGPAGAPLAPPGLSRPTPAAGDAPPGPGRGPADAFFHLLGTNTRPTAGSRPGLLAAGGEGRDHRG